MHFLYEGGKVLLHRSFNLEMPFTPFNDPHVDIDRYFTTSIEVHLSDFVMITDKYAASGCEGADGV